jgi:NAD(P)-dependent dehydrogenase (short-subunit alcohol dehydrogenase family)
MSNRSVIVVTGASRGLGESIALWLAKIGTAVTLIARSEKALQDVARNVEDLGGRALPISADVSEWMTCSQIIERTLDHFGHIDALINNAGIIQPLASTARSDPEAWRYNIGVNLLGPFYLIKAVVPELRKQQGRIINVSSGAANTPIESAGAYCAAKAALNQFTGVLASEEPALTCVAVRPGVVDTDMQAFIRKEGPKTMPPERIAHFMNLKDSGDLEPPMVPARAIAWLALHAPKALSGRFLSYDEPLIDRSSRRVFGELI